MLKGFPLHCLAAASRRQCGRFLAVLGLGYPHPLPRGRAPGSLAGRTVGLAVAGALFLFGNLRRWRKSFLFTQVVLASSVAVAACGGSGVAGGSSSPVTTAGGYTVTMTASETGIGPVSTQIALTVQ